MMCNPLRWLWGLLPLSLVWWVGILVSQPRIEEDLAQRSKDVLERAGLPWSGAVFKGRDGLVGGRAEEESEQRRAAIEVAKVWGVRNLEDRTEVLELIKTYIWQASLGAGEVKLTGYVPNEAARKAVLGSARSAFPSFKVDDQMKLARGAPEQKLWLSGTNFALRQLVSLKPGASAGLEGAALLAQGEADSSKNYETVRSALTRSLPQGISLKSDKIVAPLVKPYTWGAALRGKQIELTGYAPSTAARDEIKAAAERSAPGISIVDRMSIGSGAPGDWAKMASVALAKLGQLKQGNAEARDSQLSISGMTETAETAEAVRRSLRPDVPASFNVVEQIRQDPAVQAAEEARRAAQAAAQAAAQRVAEEAARKQAADADARRLAELRRNETDEQARAREAESAAQARASAEAARKQAEDAARRAAAEQQRVQADEAARRKAEQDRSSTQVVEHRRCQSELTAAAEAGTITFQRASAELDRRSHRTLDQLAQIVKGCPGFSVEVAGHTDNEGEPGRNQRLSDRRANSVRDYLIQAGLPEASLSAIGYGEANPKVPNDSPANMARNRRIEFGVKAK